MFVPDNVNVLEPDLVRVPEPVILPEIVWSELDEKVNVPLLSISPEYDPEFSCPETFNIPAFIPVSPV